MDVLVDLLSLYIAADFQGFGTTALQPLKATKRQATHAKEIGQVCSHRPIRLIWGALRANTMEMFLM